jgi:hypothetical protein
MSFLNRIKDIEYKLLKDLTSAPSDAEKYHMMNSIFYRAFKEIGNIDDGILNSIKFEDIGITKVNSTSFSINGIIQDISNEENSLSKYSYVSPSIVKFNLSNTSVGTKGSKDVSWSLAKSQLQSTLGTYGYSVAAWSWPIQLINPPVFTGNRLEVYINGNTTPIYSINSNDTETDWNTVTLLTTDGTISFRVISGSDSIV